MALKTKILQSFFLRPSDQVKIQLCKMSNKNTQRFRHETQISGTKLRALHNPEPDPNTPMFYNRNPRNLERMLIAHRSPGYFLEKPGKDYWHKLILETTHKHVTAVVVHQNGLKVITASSREWAIRKFLYTTNDTCAYINLGRVIAQRCLESGLNEVCCDMKEEESGKIAAFISAAEEGGLILKEPDPYVHKYPTLKSCNREKPWEVFE